MSTYWLLGITHVCGAVLLITVTLMIVYANRSDNLRVKQVCHGFETTTHIMVMLIVGVFYLQMVYFSPAY